MAQLAGVPRAVVANARAYLEALESQRDRQRANGRDSAVQSELPLFAAGATAGVPPPDAVRAALATLDPDELSPKAALEALYRLRRLLDGG